MSKPHVQAPRNFIYMLCVAAARSSSDNNAIHYVLPVLRKTSRFHIMSQMQIQTWNARYSELFTVTRQMASLTYTDRKSVKANDALCARGRSLLSSIALWFGYLYAIGLYRCYTKQGIWF